MISGDMRVLLVEDEPSAAHVLAKGLREQSYAVDLAADGEAAVFQAATTDYDAVVLDVMLPKRDGFAVCRTIRESGCAVPILMVTARDAVEARIEGLDCGADDYLVKPYDFGELLARLRAVIRRHSGQAVPVLGNGIVSLDPVTREARRGDATHILSAKEFSLLHALLLRPGAILARSELEERIYGWNEEVESNAVDFLIHGVRKKLGADAIKNVRGAGWMVDKAA